MQSHEAEARLRALLAEVGINVDDPGPADVERTWEVLRGFAAEPIEDADLHERGDGLLAQHGVSSFTGPPLFDLGITRQFEFDDADGNHDHFAQLHCTFQFEPSDALQALPRGELWSWDTENFFAEALALPGFRFVAESDLKPLRLEIFYEDV